MHDNKLLLPISIPKYALFLIHTRVVWTSNVVICCAVSCGDMTMLTQVAVMARSSDEVHALAAEIGGYPIVGDISDSTHVREAFEAVRTHCGRVDVCVNNAGQAELARIADTDDATWQRMVDCNLSGTFFCCREAMRTMSQSSDGGVIVNIGSSSVAGGRVGQGAYATSKSGVHTLTETLALEGKAKGILAYCVVPTRTHTELRERMMPDEQHASTCLQPSDVAAVVVSVIMDANAHLSGQSFWLHTT
eukprot:m.200959 g.200959  ORF g.200959 m.200959 type:complete len:248 (+) comp18795_c0_seq35:1498-2241(+)